MSTPGERGFALVAAIAAVAVFAYIAFEILAADRGVVTSVSARIDQEKLTAAADAGLMIAIHGLGQEDVAQKWAIDGRSRAVVFDGMDLRITVWDERGKAPLDGLNPAQARSLFLGAGASSERAEALVAQLRDFQSADEQDTPASQPTPPQTGLASAQIRRGGFRTTGDLMTLKDMTPDLYNRIAPAVTVFFEESGPFEPTHATPLAVAAMAATEDQSPEERDLEQSGGADPVEPTIVDDNLLGRTLTVYVVARDGRGAQTHRSAIVELTGAKQNPYWIRYVE